MSVPQKKDAPAPDPKAAATADPAATAPDPKAAATPAADPAEKTVDIYKPEGLPDHFIGASDQETIDKIAKAYKGARDELAGKKNLPEKIEDYNIDLPTELAEKMLAPGEDGKDPVFEKLKGVLFKHGLSQEAAVDFATELYAAVGTDVDEKIDTTKDTIDHEYKLLGGPDKAKPVKDAVEAWITGLQNQGVIDENDAVDMKLHAQYGEGLRWLDKIRVKTGEKPIPVNLSGGNVPGGGKTEDELNTMMQDPKYWREKDPAFIDEVTKGFQALYNDQDGQGS